MFHLASSRTSQLSQRQSENACACKAKAASVVESALSVLRSREFPFLLYWCKLENVVVSFVFESLVCNKSELV